MDLDTFPLTLLGVGRSGTSAIQGVMSKSPEVKVVGETGPLIFDLFELFDEVLENSALELKGAGSIDGCVGARVREVFHSLYAPLQTKWFQKPIGLPRRYENMLRHGASLDVVGERYWSVLGNVFPNTKVAIILRSPCDNILSISHYSNETLEKSITNYFSMLSILGMANLSNVHIIDFRDLVSNPTETISSLFAFWGLRFQKSCCEALTAPYAKAFLQTANVENKIVKSYTSSYEQLNTDKFAPIISHCYNICERLGVKFCRPAFLNGSGYVHNHSYNLKWDRTTEENRYLHFRCAVLKKRNAELVTQVADLKEWIERLQSGKDWLEHKYHEHLAALQPKN